MHQFLRAIGFSDITKKQLNEVINNIIDKPEKLKVTKDSEGNEFAELSCDVAPNMGITVRGIYNDDDSFDIDYYYPYFTEAKDYKCDNRYRKTLREGIICRRM